MENAALYTPVQELVIPTQPEIIVFSHNRHYGEFNQQQRKWLKEAFGNECSHPDLEHDCLGENQVHHIDGKRYLAEYEHKDAEDITAARNAILLCKNVHQGIPFRPADPDLIHVGHKKANEAYVEGDRHAFEKLSLTERSLIVRGIKNWFSDWDDAMKSYTEFKVRQHARRFQHPYPGKF